METNETILNRNLRTDFLKFVEIFLIKHFNLFLVFFLIGITSWSISELNKSPIYKAETTILIQGNSSYGQIQGISDISNLIDSRGANPRIGAEMEIYKSLKLLEKAVIELNLNVYITPNTFPLIGKSFYDPKKLELRKPFFNLNSYAWSNETLDLESLELDQSNQKFPLIIKKNKSGFDLIDSDNKPLIINAEYGKIHQKNGLSILINNIHGHEGIEFKINYTDPMFEARSLKKMITTMEIRDRISSTGIIRASLIGMDPEKVVTTLDTINSIFKADNIKKFSEVATKGLTFIDTKLPEIRKDLEASEAKLNKFQQSNVSINIELETKALLESLVRIENKINELEISSSEVRMLYKDNHPTYLAYLEQLESLNQQKEQILSSISLLPTKQQDYLSLSRDVEVNNTIYTSLLNTRVLLSIREAGAIGYVRIIDDAILFPSPIAQGRYTSLIMYMIGFLSIPFIFVFFKEVFRRTLQGPSEIIEEGINQQIVGVAALSNEEEDQIVSSFSGIATNILFNLKNEDSGSIIMISGPSPLVGKSYVSRQLAKYYSSIGKKTILLDLDLRKGKQHEEFNVNNSIGLTQILRQESTLDPIKVADNLSLLPTGKKQKDPGALFQSSALSDLMNSLKQKYEIVVFDTAPVLAVSDALMLTQFIDINLHVVRHDQTQLEELSESLEIFKKIKKEVDGLIYNGYVEHKTLYGYKYNYRYGGYKYYQNYYETED